MQLLLNIDMTTSFYASRSCFSFKFCFNCLNNVSSHIRFKTDSKKQFFQFQQGKCPRPETVTLRGVLLHYFLSSFTLLISSITDHGKPDKISVPLTTNFKNQKPYKNVTIRISASVILKLSQLCFKSKMWGRTVVNQY